MSHPFETAISCSPDDIGRGMRGSLADPIHYSDLIVPQGPSFLPKQISGLALALDANDVGSMTVDGSNRVSLMADKSGNSSTNVLALNGAAGNYASAPDSATVSITGDIDVRVDASLNDWTPSGTTTLIGKDAGSGSISYKLGVVTTGRPYLAWSVNGTAQTTATATSAPTVSDFGRLWIRATLDVDNGAGGYTVVFYTATDGATWTQLGDPVVGGSTTSIFDSTSVVEIGAIRGGTTDLMAGLIYRAQIYNGIAGTLAFDANFATAAKLATSFTESSANAATVTINTSGATGARICGARDAYQGTVANQPVYVPIYAASTTYASNFAAGADSFMGISNRSTVAGNIDGVSDGATSYDNVLRITQSSLNGGTVSRPAQRTISWNLGRRYSLSGRYYIPSGQTDITGLIITASSFGEVLLTTTTTGAWTQFTSSPVTAGTTGAFTIYPTKAGATDYVASNSTDVVYVLDLVITEVANENPFLYFDGSNDYLKTAAFGLSQPTTVFFVGSQVTWADQDRIYSGNASNSMDLVQNTSSPNLLNYSDGGSTLFGQFPVNTRGIVTAVWNGTPSSLRYNRAASAAGASGTTAANGFTLGAVGSGASLNANITVSEILIYNRVLSTIETNRVLWYLARRNRIAI